MSSYPINILSAHFPAGARLADRMLTLPACSLINPLQRMSELPPPDVKGLNPNSEAKPPVHPGAWRAFFSVLFMGLCVSGNARPDPADFETRNEWAQMINAYAACSFGALFAAFLAIMWRKLDAYWSIVWRLYLIYLSATFLAGYLSGGGSVAAKSLGAGVIAGLIATFSGTALFYWRNAFTNTIIYLIYLATVIAAIKVYFFGTGPL